MRNPEPIKAVAHIRICSSGIEVLGVYHDSRTAPKLERWGGFEYYAEVQYHGPLVPNKKEKEQ